MLEMEHKCPYLCTHSSWRGLYPLYLALFPVAIVNHLSSRMAAYREPRYPQLRWQMLIFSQMAIFHLYKHFAHRKFSHAHLKLTYNLL